MERKNWTRQRSHEIIFPRDFFFFFASFFVVVNCTFAVPVICASLGATKQTMHMLIFDANRINHFRFRYSQFFFFHRFGNYLRIKRTSEWDEMSFAHFKFRLWLFRSSSSRFSRLLINDRCRSAVFITIAKAAKQKDKNNFFFLLRSDRKNETKTELLQSNRQATTTFINNLSKVGFFWVQTKSCVLLTRISQSKTTQRRNKKKKLIYDVWQIKSFSMRKFDNWMDFDVAKIIRGGWATGCNKTQTESMKKKTCLYLQIQLHFLVRQFFFCFFASLVHNIDDELIRFLCWDDNMAQIYDRNQLMQEIKCVEVDFGD